ncbi:MAG: tetraacyldisaccharide 4'-kinase, partial [Synergistaceae bacterium]
GDIRELEALAVSSGADGFICTEKDTVNLSDGIVLSKPLYVPRISIKLDDAQGFKSKLCSKLKPRFFVASNGHGEDAIGVVLAKKLRARFKSAEVSAFAFVGSGTHYSREGFQVLSPSAEMPSGGVIKYSIADLLKDIKHGLGKSIQSQSRALRGISGQYRTPVCVGDVYLLTNILWGQGLKPILLATAKSVHLSGHLSIEKWILKKRSIFVWARDAETAADLCRGGVEAGFDGNPIMDLIACSDADENLWSGDGKRVLLLPGSRPRAYADAKLVLDAAAELSKRQNCSYVMVAAPTIDIEKLIGSTEGWSFNGESLISADMPKLSIRVCRKEVAVAAYNADLL